MEVELPPWLDHTFLASVLQGGEESVPVTVTRFSATLAVAAGNNYMSRLYRVKVGYMVDKEEKCTSLIIKVPFTKGIMNDMVGECDFYAKEPNVYKELLPIVNSLIKFQLGPKSYVNPINNAVILEDLKELGFELCDRFKQLDFPHCEQVFKTLAKFHAASVVCKRVHPDVINVVGKEVIYIQNQMYETVMKTWIEGGLTNVAGVIKEMEINKMYEVFILSRLDKVADSGLRLCKPKTSGLNVLNHGDLMVNNILFKHTSSGEIVDVRFIDYQIVRYASPALDLIYFIWSSANEEVRESHVQELLEIYRSTLNSTLEELECEERLTAEELFEDIKVAIDWVVITVCNILPIIVCGADEALNVEEINYEDVNGRQDERYLKLYSGKHFRALLPKVMDHLQAWASYYK